MKSPPHRDTATPATHPLPGADAWQTPAFLRWSFQHMDELFPHARIYGPAHPTSFTREPQRLGELAVSLPDGSSSSVARVLAATKTDAFAVLHGNKLVAEEHFGNMRADTRHLLMSVSKSLVSSVLGALAGDGAIDTTKPVEHYLPELAQGGYAGATVRQVLDMRSGIRFSEEYLDPASEVRALDRSVGWLPQHPGSPSTLKGFLASLGRDREHGGHFAYRSCETDVLGWLCEAAGGRPFARLASELLWEKIGAEADACISLDSAGTGMFDGGISAVPRDLLRFGAMIRDGGISLNGQRVLEAEWVADIFVGGSDSATAFAAGPHAGDFPGGMYRSQFWFLSADRDAVFCLGIHGQMLYINRASGVVGVKFSSTDLPVDPVEGPAAAAMFGAISEHLSA